MSEAEISPARLALMKHVVNVQELQLNASMQIFKGLSEHPDPEVSEVARISVEALTNSAQVIDALIDQLTATIH